MYKNKKIALRKRKMLTHKRFYYSLLVSFWLYYIFAPFIYVIYIPDLDSFTNFLFLIFLHTIAVFSLLYIKAGAKKEYHRLRRMYEIIKEEEK